MAIIQNVINKITRQWGQSPELSPSSKSNGKDKELDSEQSPRLCPRDIHFWLDRIESASKREEQWRKHAEHFRKKYLNRPSHEVKLTVLPEEYTDRYNIFFSNTELLKAALLPEIPKIAVTRRFAKEQAENKKEKKFYTTVSEIVERVITQNVNNIETEKEFAAFKMDYLITGRGVLWVKFSAELSSKQSSEEQSSEEQSSEEQSLEQSSEDGNNVTNERAIIEHINFKDFRLSEGRSWKEVWWIARRHLMNRTDLVKKFGSIGRKVALDFEDQDDKNKFIKVDKMGEVWEIWDKTTRKVYFVSPGYRYGLLSQQDDPYNLDDFFPTPEPLRSVSDNDSMIPTPELNLYIKEAQDLSTNAKRLSDIVDGIRPRAFYAAQFASITKALQTADDNEYVGIDDMPRIMEMGGMQNMFAYDPIDTKQAVCAGLAQQQQNLVQNIYEITGISDIMRNIASPDETATATNAKGKFGSLRFQNRQIALNNYVKSVYKIATELVCELFTIKTLKEITSLKLPTNEELRQFQMEIQIQENKVPNFAPQPQQTQIDPERIKFFENPTWEQVKEFLQNNRLRAYLIDIETSFNIWENDEQSQRARIDLLNVFSDSVAKALPIITQAPQLTEIYLKLISFAIDSFRVSRNVKNQIEDSFAEMVENIKKAQEQPKSQEPAPEQLLAQAEIMKAQAEQMNSQTKVKEAEIKRREADIKAQEVEIKAAQVAAESVKDTSVRDTYKGT